MRKKMTGRKIRLGIFNLFLVLGLAIGLITSLKAETSAISSFSLELKEWLILEIRSGSFSLSDTGNFLATGEIKIVPGQPLEFRVLLSVGKGRSVALKGVIYKEGSGLDTNSVLYWNGGGDLPGEGMLITGQETTFAVWKDAGWKRGSLLFEEKTQSSESVYRAVFTISAI